MEGQCWEYAIEEFQQAIDLRPKDQRQVRAYGMHFREEYFPHRELGICYYRMGRIEDAIEELELSMSQTPSARAKYYLNQGRRSYLLDNNLDTSPPVIRLELSPTEPSMNSPVESPTKSPGKSLVTSLVKLSQEEYLTNQTPFHLQGTVMDDRYVAFISVNQKPLFIELAEDTVPFSVPVDLAPEGWNSVQVEARDLVDQKVQQSIRVYLDTQGPLVISHFIQQMDQPPYQTEGEEEGAGEINRAEGETKAEAENGANGANETNGANEADEASGTGGTEWGKPRQIILTVVLYDRSGITSFKLDQRESTRTGLDQLCLIEQNISLTPGVEAISFQAQDRAGNITQGQISLLPERRHLKPTMQPGHMNHLTHKDRISNVARMNRVDNMNHLARVAWNGRPDEIWPCHVPLIMAEAEGKGVEEDEDTLRSKDTTDEAEKNGIYFDITNPPAEDFTTHYQEIFLEGRIRTRKGIRKIELNGQQLFNVSEIQSVMEKHMEELRHKLLEQRKDPERSIQLLREAIESFNIYYLNQRITLAGRNAEEKITDLNLRVEDGLGNLGSRHYRIKKVPREEILKSEQRMTLALLPFETTAASREGNSYLQLQSYLNTKSLEAFISQGRFNLVEREKFPNLLIEKAIQLEQSGQPGQPPGQSRQPVQPVRPGQSERSEQSSIWSGRSIQSSQSGQPAQSWGGETYQADRAQKIGQMVAAEGVICGYIQKREDGTEILARFVEVKTGIIRLYHDVFTPEESRESLDTITAGLAMKFRDAFPICAGSIIARKGKVIRVDFGSEKGIFPGMIYNIFEDEQDLIARASISEVGKGSSEAEISEGEEGEGNKSNRGNEGDKKAKISRIKAGYRVRTR
ncbi:MAG: hypothetical protein AB1847_20620 [bacterium]